MMTNLLTIALAFAVLITFHYIADLPSELKTARADAQTAWKLYYQVDLELRASKGQRLPTETFEEAVLPEAPPRRPEAHIAGIGPTAVLDRERRLEQQEAERPQPQFLMPESPRHPPSPERLAAAARAATENGNGN